MLRDPPGAEWSGLRVTRELLPLAAGGDEARDILPPSFLGFGSCADGRRVAEKRFRRV